MLALVLAVNKWLIDTQASFQVLGLLLTSSNVNIHSCPGV